MPMSPTQIEFPLQTAICAWCKPQDTGHDRAVLSHGICLKHLRKLKLQAQGIIPARDSRARRKDMALGVPLFAF